MGHFAKSSSRRRVILAALVSFVFIGGLSAATIYVACSPTSYSVTSSAPPPSANWTNTSGAVWTPGGNFPGTCSGDSASDTNGSPTTLIINTTIPNPLAGLNLGCAGCVIDIQSGGSLSLAG